MESVPKIELCDCIFWKDNIRELNAQIVMGAIHSNPYAGIPFRYCPWCGNKLREVDNL